LCYGAPFLPLPLAAPPHTSLIAKKLGTDPHECDHRHCFRPRLPLVLRRQTKAGAGRRPGPGQPSREPLPVQLATVFSQPEHTTEGEPYRAFLEAKFGSTAAVDKMQSDVAAAGHEAGVDFDFARIVTRPNTLRAHRLVYRAQSIGHRPATVEALVERLFVAHFQRGEDIGDVTTLADIAAACGDIKKDVADYLASSEGEGPVRLLADKVTALGVSGVPFFIIQRRLSLSGAQSGEVLAAAIIEAMQ
jgi:predicted DsbA family dithiol-disulfide isomerase